MTRALRFSAVTVWLVVGLLGCSGGMDSRSAAGTGSGQDAVSTMTPEQQAALDEAMATAKQASAEQTRQTSEAAEKAAQLSLSVSSEKASESPRDDGIHDPVNESLAMLQNPAQALGTFPRDRRGEVDWVVALDQGLIEPRADLNGQTRMQVLDMDILMKGTQSMPWVKFPHSAHTKWLDCTNCHDEIFKPEMGANDLSMNAVLAGEFCGVCHGKVSFSLFVCERCHSVPHPGSGEKWW